MSLMWENSTGNCCTCSDTRQALSSPANICSVRDSCWITAHVCCALPFLLLGILSILSVSHCLLSSMIKIQTDICLSHACLGVSSMFPWICLGIWTSAIQNCSPWKKEGKLQSHPKESEKKKQKKNHWKRMSCTISKLGLNGPGLTHSYPEIIPDWKFQDCWGYGGRRRAGGGAGQYICFSSLLQTRHPGIPSSTSPMGRSTLGPPNDQR